MLTCTPGILPYANYSAGANPGTGADGTCDSYATAAFSLAQYQMTTCKWAMVRTDGHVFENGVDGQVDSITQFELGTCNRGDTTAWLSYRMCCPSERRRFLCCVNFKIFSKKTTQS